MTEERDEKGFKVEDKRHFDERGEVRREAEDREQKTKDHGSNAEDLEQKTEDRRQKAKDEGSKTGDHGQSAEDVKLPPINLATFILSLASSAQIHLGLIPNPVTNKNEVFLPMAKQTIDIIEMIQQKTKGNLTDEEAKLTEQVLYELRMIYVQKKTGAN